jgi:Tfp pilus assembly protein PilV
MVPVNLSMCQPGQVKGDKEMAAVKLCHKMAAEKALSRWKGFSQNDLIWKSRIPLSQQTKKKKTQERKIVCWSSQIKMVSSQVKVGLKRQKGLQKNRIPRIKNSYG